MSGQGARRYSGGKRGREDDGGGGSRGGCGSFRPRVDEGASHYNSMRNMTGQIWNVRAGSN